MRVLFIEPFFGGSHRDFAEGWIALSKHEVDLVTLPARFWKWRMRGAAPFFAGKIRDIDRYDVLVTSDMLDLAAFKALVGPACPPALVYFHENQLTYPLAPGETMDYQFGFTNITTALCADRVLFNSRTHFSSFFEQLTPFLNMMPDCRPKWVPDKIRGKSSVFHPGCSFPAAGLTPAPFSSPPLVVWNHRWEFDKNPEVFFRALEVVKSRGAAFRLALLGESRTRVPDVFDRAKEIFENEIIQYGYVESKDEYLDWLRRGWVVVSTALQENFGISVVEAVRFGCLPLLPDRLSYPEILPREFHAKFLYQDFEDLVSRLMEILINPSGLESVRLDLAASMASYAWENRAPEMDREAAAATI